MVPPDGKAVWDVPSIKKFKDLVGKYSDVGMIAIQKGIKSVPAGDRLKVVLIDTAFNRQESRIKIHQEMIKLGLAIWKSENDSSGYSSSSLNHEKIPLRITEPVDPGKSTQGWALMSFCT